MASNQNSSAGPPQTLIDQFCSITGGDRKSAVSLLNACNNNLELAIGMHMDGGATATASQPSTSSIVEEVRAPIPQVQEQLVQDTHHYGFRGRRRGNPRSVFDGFRNFEAEMRQQQELSRRESASVVSTGNSKKRKTLEELFRPPIDLMHKGSFTTAKSAGASSNRWLLVNIQNSKEFPCQVLNRDVWSNSAVKSIVGEHFVFWQVYHDSEEGRQYMQFYKIEQWPYVAVIDPITGENMVVWNKLDCNTFCELVTAFLSVHPSLDGTTSPPCKKARKNSGSIVDLSEDSQLEAALKKSKEETKTSSEAFLPDITDDESNNEETDLETFSDSDSEVPSVANTPVKKTTAQSSAKYNSVATAGSKSPSRGDERGDSLIEEQSQVLNSKCSTLSSENGTNLAHSEGETSETSKESEKESTWKNHLGNTEDPESRLQIRYPDGKKEQLNIPSSSKLMAVVQYVIESGYPNERFELVTNYPKRKLSYLDLDSTIKSIGLFPQETIFVQER